MTVHQRLEAVQLFGIGSYSPSEAARLVGTSPRTISRWLGGYSYSRAGVKHRVPPLWTPQWAVMDGRLEIGFRDLIELRFVKAFLDAGVGLLAIRNCLEYARECVADDHPFSTRRFLTDGKTIFIESLERTPKDSPQVLDLKRKQYAFKQVIDRTSKDLDIEDDAVARWRPYRGKQTICIDPGRSFGQPIATQSGVPTITLSEAVEAEGSSEKVARLYDVSLAEVRDAVRFEGALKAA